MTIPLNVANDYLLMEDPETVLIEEKIDEGEYKAPKTVPYAKRLDLSKEETGGDAKLIRYGVAWVLYSIPLGGYVPCVGDRITCQGNRYQVVGVKILTFHTRFRCTCLREIGFNVNAI